MYEFLLIVILIVCVLLMLIVLIQNPKGGGLSSTFGAAGNQLLGFKKSSDMVDKWTWGLAILLLALSLSTTAFVGSGTDLRPQGSGFGPEASPTNVQTPIQGIQPADVQLIEPDAGSAAPDNSGAAGSDNTSD